MNKQPKVCVIYKNKYEMNEEAQTNMNLVTGEMNKLCQTTK